MLEVLDGVVVVRKKPCAVLFSQYNTTTATGLYCEYNKPYYAKCATPEAEPVDFTTKPPTDCGDVGTKCMGTTEFVLGLGVDGKGHQRLGVCCKQGLRCIFLEPYVGVCDDPNKYAPCDPKSGCGGANLSLGYTCKNSLCSVLACTLSFL